MAASPLLLGVDLTDLDSTELGYLKNTAVIAVDLGLFNYSGSTSQTVTVSLAAAGIRGSATATNLWTGASAGTLSGTYSATLGAGAVRLLKLVPVPGSAASPGFRASSGPNAA
jgi:alpha-galactosidase